MPPIFQEGMRLILQRRNRKKKFLDMSSTDSSSKVVSDNTANWPASRVQERSLVFGMINALGGCFVPPKQTHENSEIPLDEMLGKASEKALRQPTHDKMSGLTLFTISELNKITNNFSPSFKIGQGGFGTVYKGKLKDGRVVAIKRAKKNYDEKRLSTEFCNELQTLSAIDHLNLVRLIGYAEDGPERMLVVEYVTNGNLRQHLDGHFGVNLDLATRLDIAIDVAHAITYLHLYAGQSIIHRDIKSTNILLTDNFRAKVSDFGFSRTGPTDINATHVSTQVKGTIGYVDPEYLKTFQLTQKSDVYSFGVLMVELFTGRRPIEQKRPSKERIATKWAFQLYLDGRAIEALDSRLERSSLAYLMMEKVLELAFKCAASTKEERPTMKKTAEILWNIRKECRGFWNDRLVLSKSGSQRSYQCT